MVEHHCPVHDQVIPKLWDFLHRLFMHPFFLFLPVRKVFANILLQSVQKRNVFLINVPEASRSSSNIKYQINVSVDIILDNITRYTKKLILKIVILVKILEKCFFRKGQSQCSISGIHQCCISALRGIWGSGSYIIIKMWKWLSCSGPKCHGDSPFSLVQVPSWFSSL